MKNNAQGAIEYLLIIAAAILVVAIVIIAVTGALAGGQEQTGQGVLAQCDSFQQLKYAADKEVYDSLKSDLLGYWNLNANALDSSGNNYDALACGTHCPTVVDGLWNSKAYSFDGTNDYLDFGTFVDAKEMKTIAFWAKFNSLSPTATGSDGQEIVSNSSVSQGVEVLIFSTGLSQFVMLYAGGTGDTRHVDKDLGELNVGEWYLIIATQSLLDDRVELYINNTLAESLDAPIDISNPISGSQLLFGTWAGGSRLYDGTLEEVGIWNRVISPEERAFLWNNGKGREIIFCN